MFKTLMVEQLHAAQENEQDLQDQHQRQLDGCKCYLLVVIDEVTMWLVNKLLWVYVCILSWRNKLQKQEIKVSIATFI
jgi:hypothetical protein